MTHRFSSVGKSVQAAGVLLRADAGEQMSYLRLLKLLYIGDREHLRETGSLIIALPAIATENGPLHGEIHDLIKGEHAHEELWSRHIRKRGYALQLTSDPGVLALSKQEIRTLNAVAEKHSNLTEWEIVEATKAFPEFVKNYRAGAVRPIPLEDTLTAVGFLANDVRGVMSDLHESEAMDKLLPNTLAMANP